MICQGTTKKLVGEGQNEKRGLTFRDYWKILTGGEKEGKGCDLAAEM